MRAARPGGFALIGALAALAFLEVVAIGLVALALRARLDSGEAGGQQAARFAAESAVRRAVALWDERAVGFPRPGARFSVPWATGTLPDGTRFDVEAERLNRGLLLLRGTGLTSTPPPGARATAVATVSSIPVDPLWLDFHSAIVAGADLTLLAGATIDGTTPAAPAAPMQPADCVNAGPPSPVASGSPRPGIALAAGATLFNAAATTVAGSPAILSGAGRSTSASFAMLGRIPLTEMAAIADLIVGGSMTLATRAVGTACDSIAPGNWGAPGNRAHPCFDWMPLVFAPADLTLAGGEGQGILVVAGDLTVAAGTRFLGAILVAGQADFAQAEIHGAIRTGGPSRIAATIHFDECALTRAFTITRAMRRAYRVGGRWWLPPW